VAAIDGRVRPLGEECSPETGRHKRGKDMIAEHSRAFPQPAGHQGISRGLIRVVGYGS
jgi:hypothetical protein